MSKETLALMLEADRRECTWADVVHKDDPDPFFGIDVSNIVNAVTEGMRFDEQTIGEIDPTQQGHYLRGPNAFDDHDMKMLEWGDYYPITHTSFDC